MGNIFPIKKVYKSPKSGGRRMLWENIIEWYWVRENITEWKWEKPLRFWNELQLSEVQLIHKISQISSAFIPGCTVSGNHNWTFSTTISRIGDMYNYSSCYLRFLLYIRLISWMCAMGGFDWKIRQSLGALPTGIPHCASDYKSLYTSIFH